MPPQFVDHNIGPTFIDDFAKVLDFVIRQKLTGLYHASSGESWTDYKFALEIAKRLGLENQLKKGNLVKYLETTNRPYQKNTAMDVSKLKTLLDFKLTPIKEAISLVEI